VSATVYHLREHVAAQRKEGAASNRRRYAVICADGFYWESGLTREEAVLELASAGMRCECKKAHRIVE
jgi:hypothetical protein